MAESVARLRGSSRLRRSLLAWAALGLATSEAFSLAVAHLHGGGELTAGLATLAVWLAVALVMAGGAAMLVHPDGTAVDAYGVPNGLSALRAWLCPSLLLCTTWSLPDRLGLLLWIFVGGSVGMLDAVDGWVARRFGPVTQLGKAIDPGTDALYFSVAAVGNIALGIFTWWLAALILVRYLGPLLLTPAVFLLRRRPELVRTRWGRYNTILTGLVLLVCMLVKVAGGPVVVVNLVVGLPLLVPTALLHFGALAQRVATAPRVPRGSPPVRDP
ncbi:MAG: CDP-alcohol phosphatidyltransferase family protein [Candidatus Dormibacteria bacterium]